MKSQFGTLVVNIILFIAAAVAAFIFVSAAYNNVNNIENAATIRSQIQSQQLQTYIQIVSCAYNNISNITSIFVENLGTVPLNQNQTLLFINGYLVNNTNISIAYSYTGTKYWGPYDVIEINTTQITSTNFYNIKVVSSTGGSTESQIYVNTTSSTCTIS